MSLIGQRRGRDAMHFMASLYDTLEVPLTQLPGQTGASITALPADGKLYGPIPYSGGDSTDTECYEVLGFGNHSIQVAGTWSTISVQVQASNDGTNFANLSAPGAMTAAGIYLFTGQYKFMRVYATATGLTSLQLTALHRA